MVKRGKKKIEKKGRYERTLSSYRKREHLYSTTSIAGSNTEGRKREERRPRYPKLLGKRTRGVISQGKEIKTPTAVTSGGD